MACRKVSPEAQQVFQKYVTNNTRRLSKTHALDMLQSEFSLQPHQALQMFDHFDADANGYLSLWEFQHFYNVVGIKAGDIVARFEQLDGGNKGYLNEQETKEVLEQLKTSDGQNLDEKERELFYKVSMGDNDRMELGAFVDLLARLKVYKKPKTKQNN